MLNVILGNNTEGNIFTFLNVTGLTDITSKPSKVQKHTEIKICNILSLSALLYGSESCTMKARDKSRITVAEMIFMKMTVTYIWMDHRRSKDILKELKADRIFDRIQNFEM
jgi:hypothetical protein